MSAVISTDGLYRYRLGRNWGPGRLRALFVMLNPSTADAETDDPTIRRCIGFAKREGMDGLEVVNVYAFRATDPLEMHKANDPVGPDNFDHLCEAAEGAALIICAWGANAGASDVENALFELRKAGRPLWCLGLTKQGHPRHPLYVRADQPLILWTRKPKENP